jgi:hypothetical protein
VTGFTNGSYSHFGTFRALVANRATVMVENAVNDDRKSCFVPDEIFPCLISID